MARRVNSKFLIIFSAVLLLGAATAFLVAGPLQNLFRGDRSKKLIAQGDAYLAEADAAKSTTEKKEKHDKALYAGTVTNPRDLQAMRDLWEHSERATCLVRCSLGVRRPSTE